MDKVIDQHKIDLCIAQTMQLENLKAILNQYQKKLTELIESLNPAERQAYEELGGNIS